MTTRTAETRTVTEITTPQFLKVLESLAACGESIEWVKAQKDARSAWESCQRVEWLEWLTEKFENFSRWEHTQFKVINYSNSCQL